MFPVFSNFLDPHLIISHRPQHTTLQLTSNSIIHDTLSHWHVRGTKHRPQYRWGFWIRLSTGTKILLMMPLVYTGTLRHTLTVSTFKRICLACGKTCSRQQELDRHYQCFHLPRFIFCPHSGCQWRGNRTDDFDKHLNTHNGAQRPAEKDYLIYDVKLIVDWIKNSPGNDFLQTAQNYAVDLVKERALELGKPEWLEDPWGHSERQARHDRRAEASS